MPFSGDRSGTPRRVIIAIQGRQLHVSAAHASRTPAWNSHQGRERHALQRRTGPTTLLFDCSVQVRSASCSSAATGRTPSCLAGSPGCCQIQALQRRQVGKPSLAPANCRCNLQRSQRPPTPAPAKGHRHVDRSGNAGTDDHAAFDPVGRHLAVESGVAAPSAPRGRPPPPASSRRHRVPACIQASKADRCRVNLLPESAAGLSLIVDRGLDGAQKSRRHGKT